MDNHDKLNRAATRPALGGSPYHIIVFAMGSEGDVNPPLAIAKRLISRGQRVTFVAHEYFRVYVESLGVEFAGFGQRDEYIKVNADKELWRRGVWFKTSVRMLLDSLPETWRAIDERFIPGRTLAIATPQTIAARLAREKLGIPLVTLHIGTNILRSCFEWDGAAIPSALLPLGRPLKRAIYELIDRCLIDPMALPRLNRFRREIGLLPISGQVQSWTESPDLSLALFPAWFKPPRPDWPRSVRFCGFPLFDAGAAKTPEDLRDFLCKGEPPIVFTQGTGIQFSDDFFESSAAACRLLRCRGILLARSVNAIPSKLPDSVRHFSYVPFSETLPHCAAIVHHGGIGTCSQAFRAGIPQLIIPFLFDQPHNARRVRALGAGDHIQPRAYNAATAAARLKRLLGSSEVASACKQLSQRLAGVDGVANACDSIEQFMAERLG